MRRVEGKKRKGKRKGVERKERKERRKGGKGREEVMKQNEKDKWKI